MWTDLGVLAPSLIVCAAFCAGVYFLLRAEIAPRRRDREDADAPAEIPGDPAISAPEDAEDAEACVTSEHEDAGDRSSGSRS
jgi:hypothetical protein